MSQEAIERVKKSLVGLPEKNRTELVLDERTGKPVVREYPAYAINLAGDVLDICRMVKEPTQIVKDLTRGSATFARTEPVQQQTSCLHHLLGCVESQV